MTVPSVIITQSQLALGLMLCRSAVRQSMTEGRCYCHCFPGLLRQPYCSPWGGICCILPAINPLNASVSKCGQLWSPSKRWFLI